MHARLRAKNPQRLSNFARRRSCWWRWRRSVHARLRVIYTPTAFRILPGEADRDAGAGAEGIGNVTSTGNSELLEVLAYQLEMETRPTPVD